MLPKPLSASARYSPWRSPSMIAEKPWTGCAGSGNVDSVLRLRLDEGAGWRALGEGVVRQDGATDESRFVRGPTAVRLLVACGGGPGLTEDRDRLP